MKYGSHPLVGISCAFALGIAVSPHLPIEATLVLLLGLPAAIALYLAGRRRLGPFPQYVFLAALLLGVTGLGALSATRAAWRPANAIERATGSRIEVVGIAQEDARPTRFGRKVVVKCQGANAGKLLVYLPASGPRIERFDVLHLTSKIQRAAPKSASYAAYLRNQEIFATARAEQFRIAGKGDHWLRPLADLRRELGRKIRRIMPSETTGGLAVAMLLGDRSGLDPELRTHFSRAGLAHVLAISGLHVGIVFVFLGHLLRFLAVSPRGIQWRAALVITLLIGYTLLTGASPSVCRAVLMLSMLELGKLFSRRRNGLNTLAAAALVQLVADPLLLHNVGFQLSYAAVAGILRLAPAITEQLGRAYPTWGFALKSSIAVCLAAQLTTAPLIAVHFQQFPTYFLLSNLILLPIVSLTVNLGVGGLLLLWVPGLREIVFGVLDFLLAVVIELSARIATLPGAVVEKLSLADPAMYLFLGMVLLILAGIFHRELRIWATKTVVSFPQAGIPSETRLGTWVRTAGVISGVSIVVFGFLLA
ncbi:MAG: ComEC/Rec2 family competence protein [Bacteroidota bacterium]